MKKSKLIYSYIINYMRFSSIVVLTLVISNNAGAQDSSRKHEVSITSTFKPVLKDAAKINFNPSPPSTDTTRPVLKYNIPDGNLLFSFQPGTLRPLALQVDTGGKWDNES